MRDPETWTGRQASGTGRRGPRCRIPPGPEDLRPPSWSVVQWPAQRPQVLRSLALHFSGGSTRHA